MHLDPLMPKLVAAAFAVVAVGLFLRWLRQPHVVVYLVAGAILGPHALGLLTDVEGAARLGDAGVVLLLFFVGMEVSLPRLLANWRVAVIGTAVQIALTVGVVAALGAWLDWATGRVMLLGFVVSLSSTAVVVSMLREAGQLDSEIGHDAVGILLVQDLALVPMLLVIGLLADTPSDAGDVGLQVLGGLGTLGIVAWVVRKGPIRLPLIRRLAADHELQVFAALLLCFGLATLTALTQLSTALGAFVAGIVVASADESHWVHDSLNPLRVLLVALFFASVGMLIDLRFLVDAWWIVALLVLTVLVTNTLLKAGVLRALGRPWRRSFEIAAMLAQVGEFSFVLAAVGRQQGLISDYGYQLSVGLIAISLLASPLWIAGVRRLTGASPAAPPPAG